MQNLGLGSGIPKLVPNSKLWIFLAFEFQYFHASGNYSSSGWVDGWMDGFRAEKQTGFHKGECRRRWNSFLQVKHRRVLTYGIVP